MHLFLRALQNSISSVLKKGTAGALVIYIRNQAQTTHFMIKKAKYYINSLSSDLPASLVVFLVALPLCLGIALGSGAPLFSGVIGGIVGGIVVGILSGSQLSVSGPAAGLTAVVVVAIGKMPAFEAFLLSVALAGVFQVVFGFIRAGVIGDYVPSAVIKGMLAAIGVILIMKQFPHLVGYNRDYEGDETFLQGNNENTFSGITGSFRHLLPLALVIGILGIGIQLLWDKVLVKKAKLFKLIPAPLVVVATGILINQWAINALPGWAIGNSHLVNIPVAQSASEFGTFFTFPRFSYITNTQVWITAVTVAIIASSSQVDAPFVLSMQFVRVIIVLLIGPRLARFLAGRQREPN